MNKKLLFFCFISAIVILPTKAQDDMRYRRSSLYSIFINHTNDKFAKEIYDEFVNMPFPEKYNDHNLSLVSLTTKSNINYKDVNSFIERNHIASRMVARWFNRDPKTGECDVNLVAARGLYNASELDKEFAKSTTRGESLLADAGEELIGNTFLIVNDVTYFDKNEGAKAASGFLQVMGAAMSAYTGDNRYSDASRTIGSVVETIKGFKVKIRTRLYQLVWDEETAATFYRQYWVSRGAGNTPDAKVRCAAFDKNRGQFRLVYVGEVLSKGNETSFLGINEDQPGLMIRKACARAIDENVVDLQRQFEQFRVKTPIHSITPYILASIGMKEGVTEMSRFEVLEAEERNGKIIYNRVGVVRPVRGMVWDNRYMAVEEGAPNANLGATHFERVSGKNIEPGMLIREIYK